MHTKLSSYQDFSINQIQEHKNRTKPEVGSNKPSNTHNYIVQEVIQDKNPVSIRESDTKKEEGVRRERVPERERRAERDEESSRELDTE